MAVTYQQVEAVRHNDSVVYGMHVSIDGQQILDEGEPKVFRIQIQDDYEDKAGAITEFLAKIETGSSGSSGSSGSQPISINQILAGQ